MHTGVEDIIHQCLLDYGHKHRNKHVSPSLLLLMMSLPAPRELTSGLPPLCPATNTIGRIPPMEAHPPSPQTWHKQRAFSAQQWFLPDAISSHLHYKSWQVKWTRNARRPRRLWKRKALVTGSLCRFKSVSLLEKILVRIVNDMFSCVPTTIITGERKKINPSLCHNLREAAAAARGVS